jgi:hypothetical protein
VLRQAKGIQMDGNNKKNAKDNPRLNLGSCEADLNLKAPAAPQLQVLSTHILEISVRQFYNQPQHNDSSSRGFETDPDTSLEEDEFQRFV